MVDNDGNLLDSTQLGDMRPFSSRRLHTASQSASFGLKPEKHVTLIIKIYGQSTLFLPVMLATEQQLLVQQNISMVFVAMLIGIMFALGLNNLYLYYSIGDKTYAYYCFYLTSLIGFSLYTSGLGYQYFWRDMMEVQNVITFVFLGMLFHGALAFSQYYLRTEVRMPIAHRFINYFKYFAYLSVPVSILLSKAIAVSLLTVVNITFIITVIYCGTKAARQRYTPAYFYLASWFFLVFGLFTYNLTVKGFVEPNFFTTKAIAIGSAIEAILLSSALAFRMKNLIVERNEANNEAKKALINSNREMAISLEAAARYNRVKDEFLNVINHELRTPMNGIIGNLQLMGYENSSQNMQKYLLNAECSSKDMMNIIDNMLFVTESTGKAPSLNISDVCIRSCYNDMILPYQELAEQKGIGFNAIIDDNLPETIKIDGQKYARLIEILIDNGIKFTHKGSVKVGLSIQTIEQQGYLKALIEDTGSGMSESQKEKLFTLFSQENTSNSRPVEGLGLGLAVAKQLAEILGAKIEIESELQQGTKATVFIKI